MKTPLAEKLRNLAHTHPAHAEELRAVADKLDAVSFDDIKKLLGTWARARKLYCELTGEPLV